MAVTESPNKPKAAHVNMMTDTIIANLSQDALRCVVRGLLASCPSVTGVFENETKNYLQLTTSSIHSLEITQKGELLADNFHQIQSHIRCMLGCGLGLRSLSLICKIIDQVKNIDFSREEVATDKDLSVVASLDGDIVQAATAIQKTLVVSTGTRKLWADELVLVVNLYDSLVACHSFFASIVHRDFLFQRGLMAIASLLGRESPSSPKKKNGTKNGGTENVGETLDLMIPPKAKETMQLKDIKLPRIFCGLWQLSSPAWGSAPAPKIMKQFVRHVQSGFTAFDMADHYGDAEIMFGQFRASYPHATSLFAATKYCVFHPLVVTRETVQANVTERCQRLAVDKVDLLQFHWQFYEDGQYLDALKFLQEDTRVGMLGLCNFDTEHMQRVIDSGIAIYTNQVQFSLIDSRPTVKMHKVCQQNNVKLLTYGTLCGGFLSEKWLDKAEPDLYGTEITPSQRKYYTMIRSWGSWDLFQELLRTLKSIALKNNVSISNVATRWVLDFPYVGAVIVGSRMGISEHIDENLASFGWSLDNEDQEAIESVLKRSQRLEMFESMGDCGGEYR